MNFLIECRIRPGASDALKQLREHHLRYIRRHLSQIRFGGPARAPDGSAEAMLIVVDVADRSAAEAFIAAEPYAASGRVFEDVRVRAWSQVVPENSAGALDLEIAREHARAILSQPNGAHR